MASEAEKLRNESPMWMQEPALKRLRRCMEFLYQEGALMAHEYDQVSRRIGMYTERKEECIESMEESNG